MSSREREILERQRRLAAKFPSKPPAPPAAAAPTIYDQQPPGSSALLRRPSTKKPLSSLAVLAAARASAQQQYKSHPVMELTDMDADDQKPSPRVTRKQVDYDATTTSKTPHRIGHLRRPVAVHIATKLGTAIMLTSNSSPFQLLGVALAN